ncbi:hypothetical protein [Flavobacterium sp. 7A]|uniref:hypothetical protein n=1 Tax=Flavobacterium sp. 7A TaxID=2940571 RepID=UPI002225D4FE|nr:hypothetical protein [Flavobacterium sp. 7A]MCW2119113.1 hypothetical protein [Flavobacterium sp. 7A]
MKYQVTIDNIQTIDELNTYWTLEDYVNLLGLYGFPDAKSRDIAELRELLFMAISDYEPNEAAVIILTYKLSEELSEGQIDQISNDMLLDKVCEEYPVIKLHARLFHCNQMLHHAFNGKFPNAKAVILKFKIISEENIPLTNAQLLKTLNNGLSDNNLIKRLFDEPMTTAAEFPDADGIVWEIKTEDNQNYEMITSEYWLDRTDLIASEFEGEVIEEA